MNSDNNAAHRTVSNAIIKSLPLLHQGRLEPEKSVNLSVQKPETRPLLLGRAVFQILEHWIPRIEKILRGSAARIATPQETNFLQSRLRKPRPSGKWPMRKRFTSNLAQEYKTHEKGADFPFQTDLIYFFCLCVKKTKSVMWRRLAEIFYVWHKEMWECRIHSMYWDALNKLVNQFLNLKKLIYYAAICSTSLVPDRTALRAVWSRTITVMPCSSVSHSLRKFETNLIINSCFYLTQSWVLKLVCNVKSWISTESADFLMIRNFFSCKTVKKQNRHNEYSI